MASEHQGIGGYRPRKRSRPFQKRQKGQQRQKDRLRYLKTKNIRRVKQKQRYKQIKRNPSYTRRVQRYRKNPSRWKRRMASDDQGWLLDGQPWESDSWSPPGIEFALEDNGDWLVGHVTAVWAQDWLVDVHLEDGRDLELDVDDFLSKAVILGDQDQEDFFELLDEAAGAPELDSESDEEDVYEFDPPTPEEWSSLLQQRQQTRVAARWLAQHGEG